MVRKKPVAAKDLDVYTSPSLDFVPSGQKRTNRFIKSGSNGIQYHGSEGHHTTGAEKVLIEPKFSSDGEVLLQGCGRSSSSDSSERPKSFGRSCVDKGDTVNVDQANNTQSSTATLQSTAYGFQRLRTSSQSQPQPSLVSTEELAVKFMNEGDFQKAEYYYTQAVGITRPTYNAGGDGDDYIRNLIGLVKSIRAQNNVKNAIISYEELIGVMRVVEGSSNQDTLIYISELACLYRKDNQLPRALPLFVECYNAAVRQYSDIHPNTIVSKNNLANAYADLRRYDDAERLYMSCIEISKSQYGEGHESTLQYMNNLALVYIDQKRYKEAKYMFGQCIAIGSSVYGNNHPMVQQWRQNQKQLSQCVIC